MANPRRIGPQRGSTPADFRASSGHPRELPEDLLRDASRRLGVISLLGATLWVVSTAFDHRAFRAMTGGDPAWLRLRVPDAICGASVLVSLVLFFSTRKRDLDPIHVMERGAGNAMVDCAPARLVS